MPQKYLTVLQLALAYWPILLCSFVVSFVATPMCRAYARRHNIVDRPDDRLKPHKRSIPYLGGMAIFCGWAVGLLLALAMYGGAETGSRSGSQTVPPSQIHVISETQNDTPTPAVESSAVPAGSGRPGFKIRNMVGILIAGAAATLLGLLDDLRAMSPKKKLLGLTLATIALFATGVGNEAFRVFFRVIGPQPTMPYWLVLACSLPIVWFVVAGACNATNLIDGMDGLCSGVLAIMAGGFLVLAVHMHTYSQWEAKDAQRVVLSLAMMGAALGFLPYNRNPATIFMGDAGSMLLGITAAILLLLFADSSGVRWMMGAIMVFGLPLADMVLTLVRRWRNGRPLMQGDRSHYYDQLVDRGWPVRKVIRLSYAIAIVFAIAGCAAIGVRVRYLAPIYIAIIGVAVYAVRRWNMVSEPGPSRRTVNSSAPGS